MIVNDATSCVSAIKQLLSHQAKPRFVGFDCEWKSNIIRGEKQNKISLIQIGHKHLIILIRIHLFFDKIPSEFISFLGDVEIIKCGVGIYGDVKKLYNDYNINMYGVVDINDININNEDNMKYLGLEKISNKLLNKEMKYKHIINHREWENSQLNDIQIHYASDDAIVAFMAFNKIIETQYNKMDLMEVCFGKIDTNLNGSKSQIIKKKKLKIKSSINMNKNRNDNKVKCNILNGKKVTLLDYNGDFITIIQSKFGKILLRRNIVKLMNMNRVQMLNVVKPIDIYNNDIDNFFRIICIPDAQCMVCGQFEKDLCCKHELRLFHVSDEDKYECDECNKSNDINDIYYGCRICNYDRCRNCFISKKDKPKITGHLTNTLLIPRSYLIFAKQQRDPYVILLCGECNEKSNNIRHLYQNDLFKLITTSNGKQQLNEIDTLHKMRMICYDLKHRKKRRSFTVDKQNEFVMEILTFCQYTKEEIDDIKIKECDFMLEMDVDWYYNDSDYNYIVIRECIDRILMEIREKVNKWHNLATKQIGNMFKNRQIEFCEMWRNNFMKKMKPKCCKFMKYKTIEIYLPLQQKKRKNNNENSINSQYIVNKMCKHKILDYNGNMLTRCSLKLTQNILMSNKDKTERINNTQIQLLNVEETIDIKQNDENDSIRNIVWIPFKEIQCFICKDIENELEIYNVFPMKYYQQLFEDDNDEKEKENNSKYNMQCFVPLCVICKNNAIRREKEFECRLFVKHDLVNNNDNDNELELFAFKLAQKYERLYNLSIDTQNNYCWKILNHFNIEGIDNDKETIMIKEYHCNNEIDIDWYYLNEYNYILIKQCIEKLIEMNYNRYKYELCEIYKRNKLQFISMWIDNFMQNIMSYTINQAIQPGFEVSDKIN